MKLKTLNNMKITILYVIFISLIYGCQQKEEKVVGSQFIVNSKQLAKANSKIENFLKDTLLNVGSFIPQEGIFKVDSAFNSPFENDSLRNTLSKFMDEKTSFDELAKAIGVHKYIYKNNYQRENDSVLLKNKFDLLDSLAKDLKLRFNNSIREFIGWKVKYQFQIKDFKNQNIYVNCTFIFNSSFDTILEFKDNLSDKDSNMIEFIVDELNSNVFSRSLELRNFDKK